MFSGTDLHEQGPIRLPRVVVLSIAVVLALSAILSTSANGSDVQGLKQAVDHLLNQEDNDAESILLRLSEGRNDDADVVLGFMYSDPLSPLWDSDKALKYYRRAAEAGNPDGMFQLAESHFWSTYRMFQNYERDLPVGVTRQESHALLREAIGKRHVGARVRLAIQCLTDSWSCSDKELDELTSPSLIAGTPRLVANVIKALTALQDDDQQNYRAHLRLGMRAADPLVAAFMAFVIFNEDGRSKGCPERDSRYWFLKAIAEANKVELIAPVWSDLSLEECFASDSVEQLRDEAAEIFESRVENQTYSNWCFQNATENPGKCVLTSLWDDAFSCSRLSMPRFLSLRSGKRFVGSKRYNHCRENLIR